VFDLAVPRGLGQRAGNSTELDGLKDDRRMNLIEGPDHLNAKVLVSAEEHGVEDGAPGQHPSLVAMRSPQMPAPGGVIGSEATALGVGYWAEICHGGHAQIWPRATTAAVVGADLLMAGRADVDHSDSRIVCRAGQVVCGPENHS
jgi:hypothetical protein